MGYWILLNLHDSIVHHLSCSIPNICEVFYFKIHNLRTLGGALNFSAYNFSAYNLERSYWVALKRHNSILHPNWYSISTIFSVNLFFLDFEFLVLWLNFFEVFVAYYWVSRLGWNFITTVFNSFFKGIPTIFCDNPGFGGIILSVLF